MCRLLIFIIIACNCFLASAQTYYYERIAIVTDNIKRAASGDGHFITFTPKACYDSDINGYSEEFGVLMYEGVTDNNLHSYYGKSYFGNAYYFFASDRSRLNIKKGNGEILVYVRKSPPDGVVRSSRTRPASNSVPVFVPHENPDVSIGTGDYVPAKKREKQSRYGYYDCTTCYGTGNCQICGGDGIWRNSLEGLTDHLCPVCPNSSGRCASCGGKGKKYGIVR